MGVFYIGGREGRCGVFRRLCVSMLLLFALGHGSSQSRFSSSR